MAKIKTRTDTNTTIKHTTVKGTDHDEIQIVLPNGDQIDVMLSSDGELGTWARVFVFGQKDDGTRGIVEHIRINC